MDYTLIIRADASSKIGGGHVMRCLAVADEWVLAGGKVIFVCAEISPRLTEKLKSKKFDLLHINAARGSADDAEQTAAIAIKVGSKVVVADGYEFGYQFQEHLKSKCIRLLIYDDACEAAKFCCNILVNQNIHATKEMYSQRVDGALLLTGPSYASLRSEFKEKFRFQRDYKFNGNILISLGLSDTVQTIAEVLKGIALSGLDNLKIEILIDAGDREKLFTVAKYYGLDVTVLDIVDNFSEKLWCTSFAILAAGGTALEAASLSTPMILVCVADNQIPAYREFIRRQIALDGGMAGKIDPRNFSKQFSTLAKSENMRKQIGTKAALVVDGAGAKRVVESLIQLSAQKTLA